VSQQINLYNPLFLKQEKYFSARAMLQALGMIALGLVMFYAYALVQTRESERLAADNQAQVAMQRDQFAKFGSKLSLQQRSKALESEVARLEAEVKLRQSVVAALRTGELGNTAGFSAYFAALGRKAMPGVWLTGFSVGESGNDLQLRGRVLHPDLVPAYLRALNDEPVMRGRQVTELKLTAKATGAAPQPAGLERFVEFSLAAQRRAPGPEAPGAKPASKGGGS
jgi:cell division protein FtsL